MRLPANRFRRPGFTLIEVIVAAGLCMLIMSLLAGAFSQGIDTFSLLKSTGELNDRLAVAKHILGGDLREVHLEDDTGLPLRVSNVRYDIIGTPLAQDAVLGRYARPPARGFFRIQQNAVSTNEGIDPDGIASSHATSHVLHMTVRRTPDQISKMFLARVPNPNPNPTIPNMTASSPTDAWTSDRKLGLTTTTEYPYTLTAANGRAFGDFGFRLQHECIGALSGVAVGATDRSFASNWAEVAYFLRDTGTTTVGPTPQPLFSLHRRVRLLTKNDRTLHELNWQPYQAAAPGMSCAPGTTTKLLNGPGDITNPVNRMGGGLGTVAALATGANIDNIGPVADAAGNMTGEDILLTNVLSFEIKASWDPGRSTFTNPGNLVGAGPRYSLPVRPVGGVEIVPGSATPIPLNAADTPTAEAPFDDLPLAPSIEWNWNPNDTSMNAHTFPQGSGNPIVGRWYMDNTYTTGMRRIFDTWTSTRIIPTAAPWDQAVSENPMTPRQWLPNPNYVPLPIRVRAIQIKLRIYDTKNQLTRQLTFVQDL
jgi:hypothetical protein